MYSIISKNLFFPNIINYAPFLLYLVKPSAQLSIIVLVSMCIKYSLFKKKTEYIFGYVLRVKVTISFPDIRIPETDFPGLKWKFLLRYPVLY